MSTSIHRVRKSIIQPVVFAVQLCLIVGGVLAGLNRAQADTITSPEQYIVEGTFPRDGAYKTTKWAARFYDRMPALWGSWGGADGNTGRLVSPEFFAPRIFRLFVCGYPNKPGNRLFLKDSASGEDLQLFILREPKEDWQLFEWRIRRKWRGRQVRLVAIDKTTKLGGWFGVSEVLSAPGYPEYLSKLWGNAIELGVLYFFHFFLFLLPGLAVGLLLRQWLSGQTCELLMAVLIASCLFGYIAFWIYFWNPTYGKFFSASALIISAAICAQGAGRKFLLSHAQISDLWLALGVTYLVGLFYLSVGFLLGGSDIPLQTAACRFGPPLPSDSQLPLILVMKVYSGAPLKPFTAGWLSSDRPPLQAGLVLFQYPFMGTNLHYQVLGTILHCTAVACVWAFLRRTRISSSAMAIALGFCIFSGTFMVNGFYVWPKLLPAGLLFLVAALLMFQTPERNHAPNILSGILLGSASALSLLSHGGSVFGLLPLALSAIIFKKRPPFRVAVAALVCFICLMLPWTLYQKIYDPPGDRLVKLHIGGSDEIDDRSALATIWQSYASLKPSEIMANKKENFKALVAGYTKPWRALWRGGDVHIQNTFRLGAYFHLFESFGVLNLGFFVLLLVPWFWRRRTHELRIAALCGFIGASSVIIWCLLMFGPGTTYLNHCCLFMPIILMLALALLVAWISRIAAVCLFCLHIIWFLAMWVIDVSLARRLDGIIFAGTGFDPVMAGFATLYGLCILGILWRLFMAKDSVSPSAGLLQERD